MADREAEMIHPPNSLAKAKRGDGPVKIDDAALKKAEAALDAMQSDYPTWAQQDIDSLRQALEEARGDPARHEAAIRTIYKHALELKGQGGGFGYDLITAIGDLLNKFTESRESLDDRDFAIISAHIDALQAVVREDIKGGGGAVGTKIIKGLHKLVAG